ncbi:MAG: hydrolase, partial [Hyphomonadaceae bacterium]
GEFSRKPSQQIIEQMIFTPFAYEDVAALIQQSDPRLYVFSSDYPHVEGGRAPYERFKKNMGPLPESDQTRFFATNFAEMFAA